MASVRIHNVGNGDATLPPPFRGVLKPGQAVVLPMTIAEARLRVDERFIGNLRMREVVDLSADSFPMNGVNVVTEPGTARTIGVTDDYVRFTNGAAIAVTLPANMPIGLAGLLRQVGAGAFTIAGEAGAGITVNAPFGKSLVSAGVRAMVTWIKVGALEYDIVGDTV